MTDEMARSKLMLAIGRSKGSLSMVGESDWTPQDSVHRALVETVEEYLRSQGRRLAVACAGCPCGGDCDFRDGCFFVAATTD